MSREGKILYTIAPEDGGWRLTVDRPDGECTEFLRSYQFVGPIDAALRYVASSAEGFQKKYPSANEMVGGYFVHDRREWKRALIDGGEEIDRLKDEVERLSRSLADAKYVVACDTGTIKRLQHEAKEHIRKIGNLRAQRDRVQKELDGAICVCIYCDKFECETDREMKEHHLECEGSPMRRVVSDLIGISASLEDEAAHLRDEVERLNDENERLKTDNAELQAFIDADWSCVWCHAIMGNDAEKIKQHCFECDKHPIAHFKAEIDRLTADNALLAGKLALAVEANRAYERIHAKAALASTRKRGLAHLFDWFSVS